MLARSLEPLLVWAETSLFGSHGFEGVQIREVKAASGVSKPQAQAMLSVLEGFMAPCGATFAAKRLAELRMLTAHRARDDSDVQLMAAAFTQRVAQYPSDVVEEVCTKWADANQFWPTWAELKDGLDKKMRGRKQIHAALKSIADRA